MPKSLQPRRTILVVEDEGLPLIHAVDLLEDHGHAVIEARSGEEALRLLAERPDVNVLFADVRLPDLDGLELARRAAVLRPDILLILTSGVTHIPRHDLPLGTTFLQKPYSARQVCRLVEAA